MSSNPSLYSFEAYGYDYDDYSDFEEDYSMSDDDDDDDNDTTYDFADVLVLRTRDATFLECDKLKEFLKEETFCDIVVKFEDKKFNLHRVVLSLKSAYFQKLFAQNFIERTQTEIELKTVESRIFDCIVSYFYENDLESKITSENMTKLLVTLDYLQIEIDQTWFMHFIQNSSVVQMEHLFELFNFLVYHSCYSWLLLSLLKYFSKNLVKISETEYFSTIPFAFLKKILLCSQVKINDNDEPKHITKICAKWICTDINNRSCHIVDLVNAVKYRYSKWFFLIDRKYDLNCAEGDNNEQYVEKKFEELLNYSVEFIPAACAESFNIRNEESAAGPKTAVSYKERMQEILNSGELSDIRIKVGNKSFPVHRIILAAKSPRFYNLFTGSEAESLKETEIEEMDDITFELILKYIYFEKLEITSKENVVSLIKASEYLEMKGIFYICEKYVLEQIASIDNIFELFAFLRTTTYTKLLTHTEKYIIENWSKIVEMPSFVNVSIETLKDILFLSGVVAQDESDITKLCAKWVMHDYHNRFKCIPKLIPSLCRSCLDDFEKKDIEDVENGTSEKIILNNLNKLLTRSIPINIIKSESSSYSYLKPQFMASSNNQLRFFSCYDYENLNELEELKFIIPNETVNITSACATVLDTNLFVYFNDSYFYAQNLVTKRCISLTSSKVDGPLWNYQLLNCNDSVYLCNNDEGKVLKYSPMLNRWLTVPAVISSSRKNTPCIFASNGKTLFSISTERRDHKFAVNSYDDRCKFWRSLPDVINMNRTYDYPISACFSKQNLFVAFSAFSKSFNLNSRKWMTIPHSWPENIHFFSVLSHQNHVFYVDKAKLFAVCSSKKSRTEITFDESRKLQFLNVVHSI